jgi:phenylalanyl-tRNA synthetase beta chain
MIILLSELNKVLNKRLEIQLVSEALTMIGLEVEEVSEVKVSALDKNIVVGKIKTIEKHPNADKLQLCSVDSGDELHTIVCGASNIRVGDKVPLAKIGTKLLGTDKFPEGLKIKKSKIRDVESFGMLCSSSELGLQYEFEDGIFILPEDLEVGKKVSEIIELNDYMIDISITPNRGDCLSVYGICRELSAALNFNFSDPMLKNKMNYKKVDSLDGVFIQLDSEDTIRYTLTKINNVRIGPSPFWLKNFLAKMNITSINNVVDTSNFFMLTTGHPIHVFDFDQIEGKKISITTSAKGEVETLSNELKNVDNHLVVCDDSGPIALAGIIGCKRASVNSKTKNILVECASFKPSKVRASSKLLNISTESSYRFERHVSEFTIGQALSYAAELIQSICSGEVSNEYLDTFADLENTRSVKLNLKKVSSILGIEISDEEIISILSSLSINLLPGKDGDSNNIFSVPSYRFDIEHEHDLVEEVARIKGYDSIVPMLPQVSIREKLRNPVLDIRELSAGIRESFSQDGFSEVINFSFTDDDLFNDLKKVEILNPISKDSKFLRSSLIPSLLKNASFNLNHGNDRLKLFEIGNVFHSSGKQILQRMEVATICSIESNNLMWDKENFDFYDIKRTVENFIEFAGLGLENVSIRSESETIYSTVLHPGKSGFIFYNDTEIGFLGELHPEILSANNIKKGLIVSTLFLDQISNIKIKPKTLKAFGTFPFIQRDVSILINKSIEGANIINLIKNFKSSIVKETFIFDVFENPKLGNDKKSLSISVLFGADDRTLEDQEVSEELDKILLNIQKEIPLEIRE